MAAALRVQMLVLVGGLLLHGAHLAVRFRTTTEGVAAALHRDALRWWIPPAILIVTIGMLHVLGAAGVVTDRPFDDDGHVLAQIRRLLDTGALADPIGYARTSQLGASVAHAALGAVFGNLALGHLADVLGYVLVLVLVCRAIGSRDATTSVWAGLVVVTLGSVGVLWPDPSPLWLPVALALALVQTVEEPAMLVPTGLVAGALITLRLEWLPFAAVVAAVAWQPHERSRRLSRAAVLVSAILLVVVPYWLVRVTAWSGVSDAVAAVVAPRRNLWLSVLASLGFAAGAVPLTMLVFARVSSRVVRRAALATVTSIACMEGHLTESAPYYSRYLWPLVTAFVLILIVEVARTAPARISALAMVLAAGGVLLGYEARLARGHQRLILQYGDLVTNIEYARRALPRTVTDPDYEQLLALVREDRVGVWVVRPERIDYSRHAVVDLRVPRLWRQRAYPWEPADADGLIRVLRATQLRYLLIEDDGAGRRYAAENPILDLLCGEQCGDPLARMLAGQHLLGTAGATRLYELH
jgi:hypothetical protein